MRALLFVARWSWVSVIGVTLVIGTYFLQAVPKYEHAVLLASDVRGLREFQERMLLAYVSEWPVGTSSNETPADIVSEADEYVAALIARHDLVAGGHAHSTEIANAVVAAVTDATDELHVLSRLTVESPSAEEIATLVGLFGMASGSTSSSGLYSTAEMGEQESTVVYGALRYTVSSERITRRLDDAASVADRDSNVHFAELREAGEIGILFLLVGGVLSATGYGWARHRTRRAQWEIEWEQERAELGREFVSLASHELRTPLVGIYGFSELLLEDEGLPAHTRDWVERIHKESARLTRIVEDLLDVSRIESGRMEVRQEAVEFGEVLDSVFATFEGVSPIHHLRVRGDLGVRVVGDHDKLIEVLSNLVDNAIKYSVDGGLVVIEVQAVGERLEIRVIDEGVGIPAAQQAAIFERFGRLRRSETEHVRSTGLGLYLVQELLRLMKSTISVESNEGDGSTFMFSLPLAADESVEASDDVLAA